MDERAERGSAGGVLDEVGGGGDGDGHASVELEGEVHHIRGGVDGDEHVLVKLVGSLVQCPDLGCWGLVSVKFQSYVNRGVHWTKGEKTDSQLTDQH